MNWLRSNWKWLAVVVGVVALAILAVSLVPPRVEYRERTVVDTAETERQVSAVRAEYQARLDAARSENLHTVTTTTTTPDGGTVQVKVVDRVRIETVLKVVEKEVVKVQEKVVEKIVHVDRLVTVTPVAPRWRVGLEGGGLVTPVPLGATWTAGVVVERRIAGPLWLGVGVATSGRADILATARVALEF